MVRKALATSIFYIHYLKLSYLRKKSNFFDLFSVERCMCDSVEKTSNAEYLCCCLVMIVFGPPFSHNLHSKEPD